MTEPDPREHRRAGTGPTENSAKPRRRLWGPALVAAGVCAAAGLGLWLQIGERLALDERHVVGSGAPDQVDVDASVQRVDAASRELTLRVAVVPRGRMADPDGLSPAGDLVVRTSAAVRGDLAHRAHTRIATTDLPVALAGGAVTDYPFDSYDTDLEFTALYDGRPAPVRMTLTDNDALFSARVRADAGDDAAVTVDLARSNSVLVFAVFMMAAMWALAVAVVIGTRYLVTGRRGLVWPALGWMAATLFAPAAFRNTAPGNPPIGSILDYTAFLWAEAIVAVAVITTVVAGYRVETHARGPER
ncbi:DUF4436 family protein [Embleya sp. NPDC005971]|uniref:DUF4436 family protein n=1 Tax=Embleya sp. NPDC005971 TaxID=3156724 RepID=UPI0033CF232D